MELNFRSNKACLQYVFVDKNENGEVNVYHFYHIIVIMLIRGKLMVLKHADFSSIFKATQIKVMLRPNSQSSFVQESFPGSLT